MSADDVRAFFAALARSDWTAIEAGLSEDVVFEFPGRRFGGRHQGRRRVLVFLRQNQRLFDGPLTFTIHWVGTCGDRTVAQWTNAGRTSTGVDYANRGVTVFRAGSDGRIAGIQDYLDTERLSETWPRG
jgi:ketosteroid isomerase-like protein